MTQGNMIARKQGTKNNTTTVWNRFDDDDVISVMPEEVLRKILSGLTMKEAARTSVLSTVWRNQWIYSTGMLEFDYSLRSYLLRREHAGILSRCRTFVSEWASFMRHLEHVMKILKSRSAEGLRICMDLGNPAKLAEWIKFADEKEVQILDLDFSYNFTFPFFETSVYIRNKLLSNNFELKSMRVLRLVSVDVTAVVLEDFLKSSPLLETLCVIDSRKLVQLRVHGLALKLKHLELVDCRHLGSLYICAENLMTFRYRGDCEKITFESVPSLVEASFGGPYCSFLQLNMDDAQLHEVLSQLHVLKLKVRGYYQGALEGLPVFHNVKQLELEIPHDCGAELDRPVSLLSAFPSICVLKIKFRRADFKAVVEQQWKAYLEDEFPNLREMEISGYRRDPSQIEMLMSIFAKAPNLKRIVVDPLSAYYEDRTHDVKARIRETKHSTTKWLVDGLKPKVPPSVELILL